MGEARLTSSNRIINLIGIGIVLSLLGDNTLYTVLPDPTIASRVGLTAVWVGILLGINRLVRLFFNNAAGVIYDRMPRRGLLIGSMLVGALCNALYAVADGPALFLVGRVLWGLAWSGLWIGGNTVILDVSDETTRGRNSGQFQMWFFIGVATGAFLGGAFTDLFGFSGGLWVSAGITGAAVLIWLVWLPETRPEQGHLPLPGLGWRGFPLRRALPASMPVMAIRFVFAGVLAATTILWLESYIGRELVLNSTVIPLATLTGAFSAVRVGTSIWGAPLAGRASDRIGRRWPVVSASLGAGALGIWLMGDSALGLAMFGGLVAAVSSASVQAVAPAIIGDRIDEARRSRGLSVVFSLGDLASALGPPIALGLIPGLGVTGVYRMSAVLLALVGLFSALQIRREPLLGGGKPSTRGAEAAVPTDLAPD